MEIKNIESKIKEWFSQSSNTIYVTLLLIAILILVNLLGYHNFVRLDLTKNHQYTLSHVSKKIAKNLKDVISIKVYFSKKLPPYMANLAQQVNDILKEYKAYGKGNITIQYIDPSKDPMVAREVQQMGIPQVRMNVIEKDKQESVSGYLGLAVMSGDQYKVIPVVKDVSLVEYKVTSFIKKLTGTKQPFIGVLQTNSIHPNLDAYQQLFKIAGDDYTIRPIHLSKGTSLIAEPIDVLVVAGSTNLPVSALKAIDNFIMTGGHVLFMVDTLGVDNHLQTKILPSNITNLLLSYGIRVNKDLVLDRLSNLVGFNGGMFTYRVQYPFSIKAVKQNFSQENPVVKDLESLTFQWASSLDAVPNVGDNTTISTLVQTSRYSWLQKEHFNLNPNAVSLPHDPSKLKQHNLVMAVEGKLKSAFNSGESTTNARLIVVGDSDFVSDDVLRIYGSNQLFFQNALDWLGLDNDLIQIRSRNITDKSLKQVSDGVKLFFKIFNLAGAVLFLIIFGLARGYLRKKERSLYFKMLKK